MEAKGGDGVLGSISPPRRFKRLKKLTARISPPEADFVKSAEQIEQKIVEFGDVDVDLSELSQGETLEIGDVGVEFGGKDVDLSELKTLDIEIGEDEIETVEMESRGIKKGLEFGDSSELKTLEMGIGEEKGFGFGDVGVQFGGDEMKSVEMEIGEDGVRVKKGFGFGDVDVEFGGKDVTADESGDLNVDSSEVQIGEEIRGSEKVVEIGDVGVEVGGKNDGLGEDLDVEGSVRKMNSKFDVNSSEKRRGSKKVLEFGDDGVVEVSGDLDVEGLEKKMNNEEGLGDLDIGMGERRGTKRVLEFGDMDIEFAGKDFVGEDLRGLDVEGGMKKMDGEEGVGNSIIKKKRSARGRGRGRGEDEKAKSSVPNKRREEKERKVHLQQLHIDSQKLLRETRGATFKPIPVVHKPISSVLEKIRKRKLEVMKKTIGQSSKCFLDETNASYKEAMDDDDLEEVFIEKTEKVLQEQTTPRESSPVDSRGKNELDEASARVNDADSRSEMALDEQPMPAFRAPLDDTQDLFSESQVSEEKEMSSDQNSCPLEEVFAPSLLAMNLKFDSVPHDDSSSDDEEDNDKENVNPGPDRSDDGRPSDPVRAFVDEEAEEEDDSDNDIRFQEDEEEDYEDYEELKDMIATGYKENPVDNDMRNELHQKWLEQQDASGTDNLMQRLKYGSKLKEKSLFEDEDEDEEEDDEDIAEDEKFYGEAAEGPAKESVAKMNTRKAKQIISKMFSDKNDGYLSSDDEVEKRLTKQRLLDKVEEKSTLVSPAEDENSREVFGLIKKLNIVPDKKKAKPSSVFDKTLTGGKTNGFAKSSFVGRKGNHSVPSSHKQGTSTVRSFVFGRDDSNSRSSLSISEDSSDVTMEDAPPTRNVTTKFSSSQFKFSSQFTKSSTETASGPSLFEFLKRSSIQSDAGKVENTFGLTQTVYSAFKIPKKRIERRF